MSQSNQYVYAFDNNYYDGYASRMLLSDFIAWRDACDGGSPVIATNVEECVEDGQVVYRLVYPATNNEKDET
jgi:hypothetical protein